MMTDIITILSKMDGFSYVVHEIWCIYTFYTLHGSPQDPSRMNARSFLELCKDSLLYERNYVEKAIDNAQAQAVFSHQAAIKQTNSSPPGKKAAASAMQIRGKPLADNHSTNVAKRIGFDDFLSALVALAKKCYPTAASDDEEALKHILMDNVLPFASRRMPSDIRSIIEDRELVDLFKYYENSLASLFNYFSSSADEGASSQSSPTVKGRSPKSSGSGGDKLGMSSVFSNMSLSGESYAAIDMSSSSIKHLKSRTHSLLSNPKRVHMSYTSFMRFVNEFQLGVSVKLTNYDAGDLYLTQIAHGNFEPCVHKLSLVDFWELLIACALHIYKDKQNITAADKVKALIMVMWRHLEETTGEKMAGTKAFYKRAISSVGEKGELLKITQLLNERFINAWKKDRYKDYLLGPNMTKRDHDLSHSESPYRTINQPSMLSKLMSKDSVSPTQPPPPSSNNENRSSPQASAAEGATPTKLGELMRSKPEQTDLLKQVINNAEFDM